MESRPETLRHYFVFFLEPEVYWKPNMDELGPDGQVTGYSMGWRSRSVPRVICLRIGVDTLVMKFHHCLEPAMIPELKSFAEKSEQYSPITRLALTGVHAASFTWLFWSSTFGPGGSGAPNFLGLIYFHHLEELWIVAESAEHWLPDEYRKSCKGGLIEMFEWEKGRVPECKVPKVIFIDSPRDLKARIRAEL
jgi:hypothetical protein